MPSKKRVLALLLLTMIVAGLLAACGDNTATTAPTTAGATTAATTKAATTTTAAASTTSAATTQAATTTVASTTSAATTTAATSATTAAANGGSGLSDLIEDIKFDANGKKGGQVVFAYSGQFPSLLQPYYAGETVAILVARQVYGYLIGQSSNNKYYAYLLSQVPTTENGGVKVNADGKTMDLTLKLKPGLKWSDGSPLTSKDLAYTWKWVTDPDNSSLYQDVSPWLLITAVDTPDDSTAVLKFKQVYGPYLNFLNSFYPLPEKVWSKISMKSDPSKSQEATNPTVTSGPMKVDEFTPDDRVVLSRNDNFTPVWGFNAYLDKVIYRNTTDTNAALASVTSGELDEAENLDDNSGGAASKIPNTKFDIVPQYSWEFMAFNLSNPIFQDKAVRKALDIAIDKQALIKQFRTPKTLPLAVDIVPLSAFADKSLQPSKYDPEGAKKMLDDAGWKPGPDGIRQKDGKKLSFALFSTTAPIRQATAEVILTYWKAIGADVKFQGYKNTELFGPWANDGILARGKFDMGMYGNQADIDPDSGYGNYHSSQIPSEENKGNGGNYGRINDKGLDKALDDQRNTVDQGKRKEAWFAFQKILYDNTYEIPLYTRVNNFVVNNKVKNFKPNATTDGNFWNVVELQVQ
jgi:peptide/nickel transport system substrate-binding protein